jgi:hypothetical protein
MTHIAETLNPAPGVNLTPEITNALAAGRLYDMANALLQYQCSTCKGQFDEETVEAVLKRAAANTHGEAITPQIEAAITVAA